MLAEAKDVCAFTVVDNFNAVGIVDLEREWRVEVLDKAELRWVGDHR